MDNKEISRIMGRQYKRAEAELKGINAPQAYLTIFSKYFKYAEEDIIAENGIWKNKPLS